MTDISPSSVPIQQESVQFNNPVSEASLGSMGAAINYLLSFQSVVGSTMLSFLTEPQLLSALGNPSPQTWVLCDGRSVVGSQYQALTGNTNVPDARGVFPRMLNNGGSAQGTRSDAYANPDDPSGVFPPGQLSLDKVGPHNHPTQVGGGGDNRATAFNAPTPESGANPVLDALNIGLGNETAGKSISLNMFIRIN